MPIEYFEEYDRYVMITGVRDARVLGPEVVLQQLKRSANGVETQVLDANGIAGKDHLRFAVLNALNGRAQGTRMAESLAVEVLLYASAQRQIKNAIEALGVSQNSKNLAIIAIAKDRRLLEGFETTLPSNLGGERDESVLEEGDEPTVRRIFDITDDQVRALLRGGVTKREALTRLVIEKMALLSTQA